MSNDKHTPGPWEALGNIVRSPMYQPGGLPRGVIIAECRDGYYLPHTEEAKANARLIAAAPDLLEAIKQIIWKLERKEMVASCPERFEFAKIDINDAAVRMAREAFAKATGDAN